MRVVIEDLTSGKLQERTGNLRLMACPFCGGENLMLTIAEVASVKCLKESCEAEISYMAPNYSPQTARLAVVRRWNKRAPTPATAPAP